MVERTKNRRKKKNVVKKEEKFIYYWNMEENRTTRSFLKIAIELNVLIIIEIKKRMNERRKDEDRRVATRKPRAETRRFRIEFVIS